MSRQHERVFLGILVSCVQAGGCEWQSEGWSSCGRTGGMTGETNVSFVCMPGRGPLRAADVWLVPGRSLGLNSYKIINSALQQATKVRCPAECTCVFV